eukprot:COSAG05_NODE_2037_length_3654_cov_2.052321_3_plen_232_part_00
MSGRRAGDHTGLANDAQAALLAARLRHAAMSHRSPTSASTLMGGSPGEFYTSLPTYTSAHHATAAFNVLLQEARAGRPHPGSLLRSGAWGGELRPPIRTLYSDVYQGMRLGHDPLALREIIKAEPELAQQQDSEGATLLHWACFFGAHEKLVEAILLANPGAARVPSRHDGSLPMHVAASWVRRLPTRLPLPPLRADLHLLIDKTTAALTGALRHCHLFAVRGVPWCSLVP